MQGCTGRSTPFGQPQSGMYVLGRRPFVHDWPLPSWLGHAGLRVVSGCAPNVHGAMFNRAGRYADPRWAFLCGSWVQSIRIAAPPRRPPSWRQRSAVGGANGGALGGSDAIVISRPLTRYTAQPVSASGVVGGCTALAALDDQSSTYRQTAAVNPSSRPLGAPSHQVSPFRRPSAKIACVGLGRLCNARLPPLASRAYMPVEPTDSMAQRFPILASSAQNNAPSRAPRPAIRLPAALGLGCDRRRGHHDLSLSRKGRCSLSSGRFQPRVDTH